MDKHPTKIVAFVIGITSLLLNILGLALLADIFLSADTTCKLFGILLYAIGIIGMAISPFIYKKVFEYRKKDNAYDVVELAKEIIKNSENLTFDISQTFHKQLANISPIYFACTMKVVSRKDLISFLLLTKHKQKADISQTTEQYNKLTKSRKHNEKNTCCILFRKRCNCKVYKQFS